jgi:hypothetical protein
LPDYLPVSEHGLIGDLHCVALVGTNGTIDWHCGPKMLTYGNHLGLYAEQISSTGEQQGNFP